MVPGLGENMEDKKAATQMPADVRYKLRGDILEHHALLAEIRRLTERNNKLIEEVNAVNEEWALDARSSVDWATGAITRPAAVTPIESAKKQAKK